MRAKIIFFVIHLFGRLPIAFLQYLGAGIGRIFYWLPNKERHFARANIDCCLPDWDAAERERLLKYSLIESGKTLFELPKFWVSQPETWLDRIESGEGFELLEAAKRSGKGVIVAGPHLGNWEVTLQYLATLTDLTAIFRPPRMAELGEMIRAGREATGASMAPATPQGVRELIKALRKGETLGILCDQQPKATGDQGAVFAPFFGHPALTMVLVNRLARRTGAQVLFMYNERLPNGRFRMYCLRGDDAIADADPVVAATAMNRLIEQCIRRAPEHYIWSYKRFSIQPGGVIFAPYITSRP